MVKIVLYDDYKVGLLKDGNVVDVSAVVPIVQVAMDVRVSSRIVRVRSSLDN